MVTIPRTSGSRRRGAVSLASADVPIITPARDPGARVPSIRVPQTDFLGEALQEFGADLGDLAQEFGEVARRQSERQATVQFAKHRRQYNQESNQLFIEFQSQDLTDPDVLSALGATLEQRKQEILDEHTLKGGTPKSLADLHQDLIAIQDGIVNKAASASAALGWKQVEDEFETDVAPLITMIYDDPTRLGDVVGRADNTLAKFAPGMSAGLAQAARVTLYDQLGTAAVDGFLRRADVEGAEVALRDAQARGLLSTEATQALNRRITDSRLQQNEINFRLAQFEVVTGQPANERERLALLGVTGLDPASQLEVEKLRLEIDELIAKREAATAAKATSETSKGLEAAGMVRDVNLAIELSEGMGAIELAVGGLVPGTDAATLKATISAIQDRLAFEKLKEIKASGAGVGSLTEGERMALSNMAGSLSIGLRPDIRTRNLRDLLAMINASNTGDRAVIEATFEAVKRGKRGEAPQTKAPLPQVGTADEVEKLPSGTEFIWTPDGKTYTKD